MKSIKILLLAVFLFTFHACEASLEEQLLDPQRIIGTWEVVGNGKKLIFHPGENENSYSSGKVEGYSVGRSAEKTGTWRLSLTADIENPMILMIMEDNKKVEEATVIFTAKDTLTLYKYPKGTSNQMATLYKID